MRVAKNNKGFTLIELIVALAVMSIVMVEIFTLMSNSSVLYRKGSAEVDLQAEAQQLIQQMEELMIDCNNSISINRPTLVNSDNITISNNDARYNLVYSKANPTDTYGTVYMTKEDFVGAGSVMTPIPMAEYVESVSVNMGRYQDYSMVTIEVVMYNDMYHYSASKDIYLRNNIGVSTNGVPEDAASTYDYELCVLRYRSYDLDKLFNDMDLDGNGDGGYDYVLASGGAYYNNPSANVSNPTVLQCKATVNQTASDTKIGPYIVNMVNQTTGAVDYTIGIYTDAVRVGAAGNPDTSGYGFAYLSTVGTRLDGFTPVYGVDLSSATSVDYALEANVPFDFMKDDFQPSHASIPSGNVTFGSAYTGLSVSDTFDYSGATASDYNSYVAPVFIDGQTIKIFKVIPDTSNPGQFKKVAEYNYFNLPKIWLWTDKDSNSCVVGASGQFQNSSKYDEFLIAGCTIYVKTTYHFPNYDIDVYSYMWPVSNSGVVMSDDGKDALLDSIDDAF